MRTGMADQQLNVPVPELEVSVFFLERSTGPGAALFSATSLLNVKKTRPLRWSVQMTSLERHPGKMPSGWYEGSTKALRSRRR